MEMESFTFLPDGSVYAYGQYNVDQMLKEASPLFSELISLDFFRVKTIIDSPIGKLDFIWTGSPEAGVSSLLKNNVTINSAIHLPGKNPEEEDNILNDFIDNWRNMKAVKKLDSREPFFEAFSIVHRPYMCSVNWAAIKPALYQQICKYDLYISSAYFEKVNR